MRFLYLSLFVLTSLFPDYSSAQSRNLSSSEIKLKLEKLAVLGSVLYFAAHPDDENTKLIAYLAQDRKYRTAYLSLTRGDGGQNLIGTEQGIDLGLIRTQELLAARHIDKGEQFFTSAYDFGFSKTHAETFNFWDKETVLREAVWIIRKLQPDVIITRFPPDERGGHGHHQASALLAHEAYLAAADPKQFPEQLHTVQPWKAKRLVWNTANFGGMNNTSDDQLKMDIGNYNPLVGKSYGEISATSRSQHKSQGFGSASSRGKSVEYFQHVAGTLAKKDLFEDIETSWKRVPNMQKTEDLIHLLNTEFDPSKPEKSIQNLLLLLHEVESATDPYWSNQKVSEIKDLIIACAGIWVDATSEKTTFVADESIPVTIEAIVRAPSLDVQLQINNSAFQPLLHNESWKGKQIVSSSTESQPYWLIKPNTLGRFDVDPKYIGLPENPNLPGVQLTFKINNQDITIFRSIEFRYVDPVRGEVYRPIVITPDLTVKTDHTFILAKNGESSQIGFTFENQHPTQKKYNVKVVHPEHWDADKEQIDLDFSNGNLLTTYVTLKPKTNSTIETDSYLSFQVTGQPVRSTKTIAYEHIPTISWFPPVNIALRTLKINNPIKKIGYLPGAGDLVSESLAAIGIESAMLNTSQILAGNLQQYDAIVLGVRFFNTNTNGANTLSALLKYAENGGTVLVQYNVNNRLQSEKLGPYPFQISRDRVTEEDAAVKFDSKDLAFNYPNKITEDDFKNWIQERGLYFVQTIDQKYRTPITMHDENEKPNSGSLLIASYGKGKFVYTSLSFFRQLPAGIPGAYRLFVNLLAKEE